MIKNGHKDKEEVGDTRKGALSIQGRLYLAITEDAESFEAVMDVIRLPRDTEKGRLYQSWMIQKAYRKASVVPKLLSGWSVTLPEFYNIKELGPDASFSNLTPRG